jgi:hypothetical protein
LDWRNCGLAGLVTSFGFTNKVFDFASVTKVRAIACSTENVNSNRFRISSSIEILLLKLQVQDLKKLRIREVLETERVFNCKPTRKSRIDVLLKNVQPGNHQ